MKPFPCAFCGKFPKVLQVTTFDGQIWEAFCCSRNPHHDVTVRADTEEQVIAVWNKGMQR